jgi:amidohydrolase
MDPTRVTNAKQVARERVAQARTALIELSHKIHANPELAYEERLSSGWVADMLEQGGFAVTRGAGGMETALVGTYGSGPLNVAMVIEYDALPEVGHACGHNIIAASSVGAALGLVPLADDLGIRISAIGTPAEEGGNGKAALIDAGVFADVHCALMIHPGPTDVATPEVLAAQTLEVTYTGRSAHAGAYPERGINAGDAMVVAQVAIGQLRQALIASDRVHGIVTLGGEASNIIPSLTKANYMVRAGSAARLEEVRERVMRCFEAGALASGATIDVMLRPLYADMIHDPDLVRMYAANAEALGRSFGGPSDFNRFSTDMGNVSYVVPSIHPVLGVEAHGASNHQPAFAAATVTPSGDQAVFDGAVALAWTAIDAALDEHLRARLLGGRPA